MEPLKLGAHTVNKQLGRYTGSKMLLDPKLNVNGAVIQTGYLMGSGGAARITMGTQEPKGYADEDAPVVLLAYGSSEVRANVWLTRPVLIPAGQGLYTGYEQASGGYACLTYDLLP
jgi:hypothetical protein